MKSLTPHSSTNKDILPHTSSLICQRRLQRTDESNLLFERLITFKLGHPSNSVTWGVVKITISASRTVLIIQEIFPQNSTRERKKRKMKVCLQNLEFLMLIIPKHTGGHRADISIHIYDASPTSANIIQNKQTVQRFKSKKINKKEYFYSSMVETVLTASWLHT